MALSGHPIEAGDAAAHEGRDLGRAGRQAVLRLSRPRTWQAAFLEKPHRLVT